MQKTSADLPERTNTILNKIIDSTSQMMEGMNDMVWTIKADNDNFEQVVNRMRSFAVNMTEAKRSRFISRPMTGQRDLNCKWNSGKISTSYLRKR